MLEKPTFRSTGMPLILLVLVLVVLNVGLYTRLASQPSEPRFSLPYYEDFANLNELPYETFGGDWDIRDETLVQFRTSGFDLMTFVPIAIAPEQSYIFETTLRYLGGTMGGGVLFNAQQTTSRQQSHMVRFNVDQGRLWLIYGFFGDDSDFIGQGSVPLELTPDDGAPHRLRVQVSENQGQYALFLDDALLVEAIPLQYRGGAVGFITATSQVSFDDIVIDVPEALASAAPTVPAGVSPAPDDGVRVFVDDFNATDGGPSRWLPISGDWLNEGGALIQRQRTGFDHSNIYQQPFAYPLTLRTTFTHQAGIGGGVLFDLPAPDSKNGGYMVRYVQDGDAIVIAWGYFSAEGVFNGQGSATVSPPGTASHQLVVSADGQTYTVALDGQTLVENVPILAPTSPAYVGLTASQSVVAFDAVEVLTAQAPTTTDIDLRATTGDWLTEGEVITQRASANTDFIAGTGLAGEQFRISAAITLPEDNPEAGGGLVIHMNGRDDPALGTMVRFSEGGTGLFWGAYDAEGVFAGAGDVPLSLSPGAAHNLTLIVADASMAIQVNGEIVAEAIPLTRSGGWIGLVSFSGPVIFSDVQLQLGS